MTNLEYLEMAKDERLEWDVVRQVCEHEIEYRKMKALEIIAGETIKAKIDILEELKNMKIELSVIANKRGL